MPSCTRAFEFDAAHRLVGHEGVCSNLHGHRYRVEVEVSSDALDALGRVVDFGELKRTIGAWIDAHLDHAVILRHDDEPLLGVCRAAGWRVHVMPGNPTAELMASELLTALPSLLSPPLRVVRVRLYETPSCWAESRADL